MQNHISLTSTSTSGVGALGIAAAAAAALAMAAVASAQTYRVLEGQLITREGLVSNPQALGGWFEVSVSGFPVRAGGSGAALLELGDFALRAGEESFLPSEPIEYRGLPLGFLRFDPGLLLRVRGSEAETPSSWSLRFETKPELIEENGESAAFRHFEFRAQDVDAERSAGRLPGAWLPRRLYLEGMVTEVVETLHVSHDGCFGGSLGAPSADLGAGGVVISTGGGTPGGLLGIGGRVGSRVIDASGQLLKLPSSGWLTNGGTGFAPGGSGSVSLTSGSFTISSGGFLRLPERVQITACKRGPCTSGGTSDPVPRSVVVADSALRVIFVSTTVPSLDALGIEAPDGAEVTLDADGVLAVVSDGDLSIDGSALATALGGFDQITQMRITAGGLIEISASLTMPDGVGLELVANAVSLRSGLGGGFADTGSRADVAIWPQPGGSLCGVDRLVRDGPLETRLAGSFWLVASAGRAADVNVMPWHSVNRIPLGTRRLIPVELLGSEQLDVDRVDGDSLRLGPGEARPLRLFGRSWLLRMDLDRDGQRDLVGLFDARDLGLAFGDPVLCLSARLDDGSVVDGCDRVDTRSYWLRGRPRMGGRRGSRQRGYYDPHFDSYVPSYLPSYVPYYDSYIPYDPYRVLYYDPYYVPGPTSRIDSGGAPRPIGWSKSKHVDSGRRSGPNRRSRPRVR